MIGAKKESVEHLLARCLRYSGEQAFQRFFNDLSAYKYTAWISCLPLRRGSGGDGVARDSQFAAFRAAGDNRRSQLSLRGREGGGRQERQQRRDVDVARGRA